VLVAIEPVDNRNGIDSLARLCQDKLAEDPFFGCVFVFFVVAAERRSDCSAMTARDAGCAQKRLSKERSVETTQIYLDADLALKEQALAKTNPLRGAAKRYQPDDELLAFLKQL